MSKSNIFNNFFFKTETINNTSNNTNSSDDKKSYEQNQSDELDSQNNSDELVSDNQSGELVSDNQSGELVSDNQSGKLDTDNQSGELDSENEFKEDMYQEHSDINFSNTDSEITSEYQDIIYDKYMKNNIKTFRFGDEIKEYLKKNQMYNQLECSVIKNNLEETKKSIESGDTVYRCVNGQIVKICSSLNCIKTTCSKECYKNNVFKSFKNFNRGIKTIYNILFRLILSYPNFRTQCKCCENKKYLGFLLELEKNFNQNKNIVENIDISICSGIENSKLFGLQINFLINKFMSEIGILDCECRFKNKYCPFYSHNFFNFSNVIKIYTRTIPHVIKLLKKYFEIKDNHEELVLIDDSRCIHEDIRFNNLTYCVNKKYNQINKKYLSELVMLLDLVNDWVIESIKITIILLNQQSLEHFMYSFVFVDEKKIDTVFDRIYNLQNEFIDINYTSNKNNIVSIINSGYKRIGNNKIESLIENITKQLIYRNKFINNYEVNGVIINFILECLNKKNDLLGFKWLKQIKNLRAVKNTHGLERVFNDLLDNQVMSIETKISYLKIINKNKINIIEYDFVSKLIDIDIGDKIILEFKKEENTLFCVKDYKNELYIANIIKKCIVKNKINILDYVLFNLEKSIKDYSIDTISIYLINIPKKQNNYYDQEYLFIDLLKVILKYHHISDVKIISGIENKKYQVIEYCIDNKLNLSAKIFIKNNIGYENFENKNIELLIGCIEKNNQVIARYIIEKEPDVIKKLYNGMTVITYLFECYKNNLISDTNSLINFLFVVFEQIIKKRVDSEIINYQDSQNELFGFKLLNSNLNSNDKILLIKLISQFINPLEINDCIENLSNTKSNKVENILTYPLVIHSMLLNELEITYILLNVLVKNGYIGKKSKINDQYTIFDYYINGSKININFIPIIFKYIKDNKEQCSKFEENLGNKILILPTIKNMIYVFLHLIGFVLIFHSFANTSDINIGKSILNNPNINLELGGGKNKYMEITISSDNNNNQFDTQTNVESEILNKTNKINKNIWMQSSTYSQNLKNTNKLGKIIKVHDTNKIIRTNGIYNFSTPTDSEDINTYTNNHNHDNLSSVSNNSDLSVSDILFEYK
jgi:hypothetical protein